VVENMNILAEQPRGRTSVDEDGRGAESDCARAMAEIERVLRELALTRRSSPERLSPANEASNAPSLVPAPSPIDQLVLDAGLDFIFHKDGMIELTEAGFRRMGQAHSAGLDAVIGIDGREVLRFLAPKPGSDPRTAAKRRAIQKSLHNATEAHARRTQPVAELLRAEESTEVAINMIDKERERHEIESLLPWHAAGTLSRRDADRVEEVLADDRELVQRYELVREELSATIHLNEVLGAPSKRAMEKLFAAIDADEAHLPRPRLQRRSETAAMASTSP